MGLIRTFKEEKLHHVMKKKIQIAVPLNFKNMIERGKVDKVTFSVVLCPKCWASYAINKNDGLSVFHD